MLGRPVVCTFTDPEVYRMDVGGKSYLFEFGVFGPLLLNRRGDPAKSAPPVIFLRAVSLWCTQGKRVEDGLCIWDQPRRPVTAAHNGMRMVIDDGEEGWDW